MTISTTTSRAEYAGNGVTTVFAFPYPFFADADLTVLLLRTTGVVDTLVLNTDYTVSGENTASSGQVTLMTAPASGEMLFILRELDLTQETDYISGDPFPAESHERALDRLTLIAQQLQEQIDRSVTLPEIATGVSTQLPISESNALIGWNTAANALQNYAGTSSALVSSAMEPVVAAATVNAAQSALRLRAGSDIASAATVDFTARTGNLVIVTGTIEITSATMSNGDDFTVIAADALPINIAGVLRYTCRAGDMVRFSQDRTGVQRAGIVSRTPPGVFHKTKTTSVAFTKTGAGTLDIKAGTVVDVAGVSINFTAATAVVMPALTAGTDYAIYACADGTVRADASFTAPSGYTSADSRLIGGFHYGLVAPGTTVADGSFNTAGSVQTGGMVWTQTDVDNIAGINKFSLWDLKWRANVSDLRAQRGFVLTDAGTWVAIYFASTNTDSNGLSKYNTDVASGTVLAKIPTTMGGDGTLTYADGNWWRFSELARAYGARLLTDAEANIAFFGVTENQSLGGAASTIPLTTRQAGYTSKYGVEQATGHHWIWGDDSSGTTATAYVANGGRGQSYANSTTKVVLGGSRVGAADSGSRASSWANAPTVSGWGTGLRAACDHLMLA